MTKKNIKTCINDIATNVYHNIVAEYLESKKIDGIIFNSSVHSSGKNLVDFELKKRIPS